jgi:poly-gamma-glutamate capsule biosynthesis protein CapA/YwtB (metallophosphatase superfamily)
MLSIVTRENAGKISLLNLKNRKPKGIGISPYPFLSLIRYIVNYLFNGYFSYINRKAHEMRLLNKEGDFCVPPEGLDAPSRKIVFLGDIMVTTSGSPPELDENVQAILRTADVIVANVESPVVESEKPIKRGLSLTFGMSASFLQTIYSCNENAQWVFNIANNHACDTSRRGADDVSGVETTIRSIRAAIPSAEIIGAKIDSAHSILTLPIEDGPAIGLVGWTEVMNRDKEHYKKGIIRETDITSEDAADTIRTNHGFVIGFVHGNEEQSYYPKEETRERWYRLIENRTFDVIVGHGPHVLHPAERVGEQGLLFHSIGNFCSPVGRSQTKVGCIPEITIRYNNNKVLGIHYKIHILQQQENSVSIIDDLNAKSQKYSGIISRLKHIWGTLFETAQPIINPQDII